VFPKDPRFACVFEALRRRDFSEAAASATRLLAECSTAGERAFLLNKRGVANAALQRASDARRDFDEALLQIAEHPPALTNIGNLLFDAGEYEAAIAQYRRAISQDPLYAVAYVNLAAAYKRLGRFDEAVEALRRAQRLEASPGASWRPSPRT